VSESEFSSIGDRYLSLIDSIVEITLQGKIRSQEQIYRTLVKEIDRGTGEIFERALSQRIEQTNKQLEIKLKAARILKALETIEKQWLRWQQENETTAEITDVTRNILTIEPERYFQAVVEAIDPNRDSYLTRDKLKQLATAIQAAAAQQEDTRLIEDWQQIAKGITRGLQSFSILETDLVSWIYDSGNRFGGFGAESPNPWRIWAQKLDRPLLKELMQTLAREGSLVDFTVITENLDLTTAIELAILLQYLQRGLVTWFDRQPYNAKFGKQLAYSTFLGFAIIWGQLWQLSQFTRPNFSQGCFSLMLQILRSFARRDDFPLYSGVFVSFSGAYLQNTLEYFDEPLKQVDQTQEKARILTLLGYSQRTLGNFARAIAFHQNALEIANRAEDRACEIANFNHLSRICIDRKNYDDAISHAQRGLILARQVGDRLGEANALVNLGYSQVLAARQQETMEEDIYNQAIRYLEIGIELAQKQADFPSQALGYSSLGLAYVILARPTEAISALTKGAELARYSSNIYLHGLSLAYLAQAYYSIQEFSTAITTGCLGIYLLKQIDSLEWRQPAGLMMILRGQIGATAFAKILADNRPAIIAAIGVDGYDYIPEMLEAYQ
jgi:tetratricopeptide (TPR) repeat protein